MITEVHDDKYVVARRPCLMEDEGNWHILALCDTREEVALFVKKFTEDNTGYFRVSTCVYLGSHFGSGGRVSEDLQQYLPINIREWVVGYREALETK